MILDHQAEDRQQPVCQGVPRLHPAVGAGEGDGGGHDGVQDPQEQRSTTEQHNKFINYSIPQGTLPPFLFMFDKKVWLLTFNHSMSSTSESLV